MENTNILKPSAQKMISQGVLKEKKLETKSGEKGEYISGNIIVKATDDSTVAVRLFANKYSTDKVTGEKKENSFFTHLENVRDNYVSEAEIAKNNLIDKKPTLVNVVGARFDKNDYYNAKTGLTVQGVCVQGLNVYEFTKPEHEIAANISFAITAYLYKMADELNDGMPTGRKKCTLLFPVYAGKLAQMEVVATPEISNYLEMEGAGNTFKLEGLIKNITVAAPVANTGIGQQAMPPVTRVIRETVITYIPADGLVQEGAEGYMSPENIKLAIAEREASIAALQEKASTATINDVATIF